jgi:hypothetical protein
MKNVRLRIWSPALLNTSPLVLRPSYALAFGSLSQGIVFSQLQYRVSTSEKKYVQISYRGFQQRDFPFYTRKHLIGVIQSLEKWGAISVNRNGGINIITVPPEAAGKVEGLGYHSNGFASMLLFKELACRVGVLEALALQQIHLRMDKKDWTQWVIKSMDEWRETCFPFAGIATIKRLFGRLQAQKLIHTRKYSGYTGFVNSYRVNYEAVALALEIPTQEKFMVPELGAFTHPLSKIKYLHGKAIE